MTRIGSMELTRRFFCLTLFTLGLVALGYWGDITAVMLFAGALLIYVALPRPKPPLSAFTYEKIPAVYGPDMLGLMMTSVFIALPFWAALSEEYMWQDSVIPLHPSALLSWPLALISASILVVSASYASFWLDIKQDGLHLYSLRQDRFISFSNISRVVPFRRGLPRWIRWLTPLFILSGRYTAAGAVILARDTTGFSMCLTDGSTIHIDVSAFEKPAKKILQTLRKKGVPIEINR